MWKVVKSNLPVNEPQHDKLNNASSAQTPFGTGTQWSKYWKCALEGQYFNFSLIYFEYVLETSKYTIEMENTYKLCLAFLWCL